MSNSGPDEFSTMRAFQKLQFAVEHEAKKRKETAKHPPKEQMTEEQRKNIAQRLVQRAEERIESQEKAKQGKKAGKKQALKINVTNEEGKKKQASEIIKIRFFHALKRQFPGIALTEDQVKGKSFALGEGNACQVNYLEDKGVEFVVSNNSVETLKKVVTAYYEAWKYGQEKEIEFCLTVDSLDEVEPVLKAIESIKGAKITEFKLKQGGEEKEISQENIKAIRDKIQKEEPALRNEAPISLP